MALIQSSSGLMDTFMGKSLYPVYKIINDAEADFFGKFSVLEPVFSVENADGFGMKYTDEIGVGDFKPTTEGTDYAKGDIQEGFSSFIEFIEWTNSVEITKTMMEDNITSQIKKKARMYARSYYRSREKFRAAMLGAGKTGTLTIPNAAGTNITINAKSADGVSLFSTAHPSKLDSKKLQSNKFANTFSEDVLSEITTKMENFVDDKGDISGVSPNTIIIPNVSTLKKDVFKVIGADKSPDSPNNGFNYLFGVWRVLCSPLLNGHLSDTEFILADLDFNEMAGGAIWGDRITLETSTSVIPHTHNLDIAGRSRFSAMFHNFRAFAIGGSTGGTEL